MDAEAYADMLPWLVFLVIDRRAGLSVAWAGGCATACSAGLAAWSYWRGRWTPLPMVALAFFVPCSVVALALPVWDGAVGVSRSMAILAISVSAFASLRFTPISEAYTTPQVAPGVPLQPRFRQVNVEVTAAWGVGALLASVICAVAELLNGGTFAYTFLDWVAPLVITTGTILWCTRRWELFRLSLDGAGSDLGASAAQPVQLRAYQSADPPEDAVIRQLPVRRAHRMLRDRTL
jgi:hypothetical protein